MSSRIIHCPCPKQSAARVAKLVARHFWVTKSPSGAAFKFGITKAGFIGCIWRSLLLVLQAEVQQDLCAQPTCGWVMLKQIVHILQIRKSLLVFFPAHLLIKTFYTLLLVMSEDLHGLNCCAIGRRCHHVKIWSCKTLLFIYKQIILKNGLFPPTSKLETTVGFSNGIKHINKNTHAL